MIRPDPFGEPSDLMANVVKESTCANATLPNYLLSWRKKVAMAGCSVNIF